MNLITSQLTLQLYRHAVFTQSRVTGSLLHAYITRQQQRKLSLVSRCSCNKLPTRYQCLNHTSSKMNCPSYEPHRCLNNTHTAAKQLTIFHFNDVYNIEPSDIEPLGGAARLVTAYKAVQHKNPMVLFSGDCLNPSMISSVEKGNQMLPVFNGIGLTCAVLGNHEFDFGLEVLEKFMSKCKFPWLLSNVYDRCTGKPLAGAKESLIINWEGVKVGFVGLAEEEWLVTLPTLDLTDMVFSDYVKCAKTLNQRLREQGADIVIALTHMTMKNDMHLLKQVSGIDIVFGGHDHNYCIERVDGRYVVKSGSDFQNASVVTLNLHEDKSLNSVDIEEITLDSTVPEDYNMKLIISSYLDNFDEMSKAILGYSDSDLDCVFEHVRTKETNLGNLIADIMVNCTGADVAIINSGTLRSNCVHPKGAFSNKDLLRILPLFDQLCVLDVTGHSLIEALENGVSRYPRLDGRFPQVSGIRFQFDPYKKSGERVDADNVMINGRPLEYDKHYRVCVKEYIARGRDGYSALRSSPIVVSPKNGPVLSTTVQNYFEGIVRPCKSRGCLHRHCDEESKQNEGYSIMSHHQKSHNSETRVIPKVEGRIRAISEDNCKSHNIVDENSNNIIPV